VNKKSPQLAGRINESNFRKFTLHNRRYLPNALAIAAAFVFVLVASHRIALPGLYMDEVDFVNAARGGPDNSMIYMRLGSVPLLIMPYLGALKAWLYAPIFWLFGVSALTIRLPAILIAGVTLLIFFSAPEIARWSCLGDLCHMVNGGRSGYSVSKPIGLGPDRVNALFPGCCARSLV